MTAADARSDVPGENRAGTVGTYIGAGFDLLGLEATDDELAVIQAADRLYRPLIERLIEAELDGVAPEPATDVSGPPRTLEQR
jgi:hypothetical protein